MSVTVRATCWKLCYRQGVKSASAVFQGCLRDVELDARVIGLPEVLETVDIRPGCVWDFPCVTENPCSEGEVCSQDGHSGFRCSCDQEPCDQGTPPVTTSSAPGAPDASSPPGEAHYYVRWPMIISQLNKYDSGGRGDNGKITLVYVSQYISKAICICSLWTFQIGRIIPRPSTTTELKFSLSTHIIFSPKSSMD